MQIIDPFMALLNLRGNMVEVINWASPFLGRWGEVIRKVGDEITVYLYSEIGRSAVWTKFNEEDLC